MGGPADDEKKPAGPSREPREGRDPRDTDDIGKAPSSDRDLPWFFCEGPAALGFKSNHAAVENVAYVGVRVQAESEADAKATDKRRRDTQRYREIDGWLSEIGHKRRHVLRLAYGEVEWSPPVPVKHKLGRMFPLVPETPIVRSAYEHAARLHPDRNVGLLQWVWYAAPGSVIEAGKRQAEAMAYEAFRAFDRARGDSHRARRSRPPPRPAEDAFAEGRASWRPPGAAGGSR